MGPRKSKLCKTFHRFPKHSFGLVGFTYGFRFSYLQNSLRFHHRKILFGLGKPWGKTIVLDPPPNLGEQTTNRKTKLTNVHVQQSKCIFKNNHPITQMFEFCKMVWCFFMMREQNCEHQRFGNALAKHCI